MLRSVLISAVSTVMWDIENSGLQEMLDQGVDSVRQGRTGKDARPWINFATLQGFFVKASRYTEEENEVLKILRLSQIINPTYWQELSETTSVSPISSLRVRLRWILEILPSIVDLLRRGYEAPGPRRTEGATAVEPGWDLLTIYLIEEVGENSSPLRVSHAMDAISLMYQVHAVLDGLPEGDLTVVGCDSGSDKSFDFLGLASVVSNVRETIIAIWDRKVMYRHMQASSSIALVAESLPVIERINDLKMKGALEPEQAELMRRKVIEGATKFLQAGIVTDEMGIEAVQKPRLLMKPEQKLLTAPSVEIQTGESQKHGADAAKGKASGRSNEVENSNSEFSVEELNELRQLLSQKREAGSKAPSKGRRPAEIEDEADD